jgi:ribose 5-phosphate isomerase B
MMRIAIGSDHGGYSLKQHLVAYLSAQGYDVLDVGTDSADSVDYPGFAAAVARAVACGECGRGIAICGTGIGVSMSANRVPGIRAALCTNVYMARMAQAHNDAQVLCLGERVLGLGLAEQIVDAFLATTFEGGRHTRRLEKVHALERRGA